jgi:hypothetical protein
MFNNIKSYLSQFSNMSVNNIAISNINLKESIENTRVEILKKKGMYPLGNNQGLENEEFENIKKIEKNNECEYMFNTINSTILKTIKDEKESYTTDINANNLKHLRYESLNTCEKFELYKKFLNTNGININVYKSYNSINQIDYRLLSNKIDVFH